MASFKQAVKWMSQGKLVTRDDLDFYASMEDGVNISFFRIKNRNGSKYVEQRVSLQDVESKGWERFKEEASSS